MPFDIVTVCYSGELNLLRLQARSVARFVPDDMIGRIVLVANDVDEAACLRGMAQIGADFGRHAKKVQIVSPAALLTTKATGLDRLRQLKLHRNRFPFRNRHGGWRGAPGWNMQQALKLASVRACTAEFVLILDAKNHFLQAMTRDDLFTADGRPRATRALVVGAEHRSWLDASFRALGLAPPSVDQPVPLTVTPFLVSREDLAFALKTVEDRVGAIDVQFLRSQWRATEFCLVFAAVDRLVQPWWDRFGEGLIPSRTIFRANSDDEVKDILASAERGELRMLGLHSARLESLSPDLLRRVRKVWSDAGLIGADDTWI